MLKTVLYIHTQKLLYQAEVQVCLPEKEEEKND